MARGSLALLCGAMVVVMLVPGTQGSDLEEEIENLKTECKGLLGPPGWLCEPEPDAAIALSECQNDCITHVYDAVEPENVSQPGTWWLLCRMQTAAGVITIDQVSVGPEPACIEGEIVRIEARLLEPAEHEAAAPSGSLVTVAVGECELTLIAELYGGLGLNEYKRFVPCADFP